MTHPAQVLILFSTSGLGGAERSLTRMALMPGAQMTYHLATLAGEGPWTNWTRAQGKSPIVFGGGLIALLRVPAYVRRKKIDIVYVCGLKASLGLRLLKPFMPGVRLVHGIRWNPGSPSRLDRTFRLVERLLSPLVDLYITNSKIAAQTLQTRCAIPAAKIRTIYNGLTEFPAQEAMPPYPARPIEILTVANFVPRKGHREVLPAIAQIVAKVPGSRFIWIGRDDMNGEVQAAITAAGLANTITCAGTNPEPFWSRARVFVLPSLWNEGCPTAILEALSWGIPVVAYAMDGIPELVESGTDGLLAPLRDEKALAESILALLNNEARAETMGQEGRRKVMNRFSAWACARLHDQAFDELMKGKTKP